MQAQELRSWCQARILAWHQLAFAFGASQDQYEALRFFVPPLEQTDFLLAVWGVEGGGGRSSK